ncbi:MAG: transmembrane anchor protein [Pseudomonadota bacterium]
MYNAEKPNIEELPTSAQLLRSTIIALVAAVAILVTIVLPAEYAIDPTGIGRVLGLTEMGEIKRQLAEEAESDHDDNAESDDQSSLRWNIFGVIVGSAHAQEAASPWTDEISFTLKPGKGTEWKLVMEDGATAEYRWVTDGGRVNYDLHGSGGGNKKSYKKGRGSTGEEGSLTAAFKGNHGWFWRNRDKKDVTVTLQVRGDYSDLKRF